MNASTKDFSWKPCASASGVFERDVDEAELFYIAVSRQYERLGRTAFGMTAHATLDVATEASSSSEDLEERFRSALSAAFTHLLVLYPALRSWAARDESGSCKRYYSEQQADDLVDRITFVDRGMTGLEYCNSDPPFKPYAELVVITPPASSAVKGLRRELLLRLQHDQIDGMGAFMLLDALLSRASALFSAADGAADLKSSDCVLSPPLRVAAGIPQRPSPAQQAKYEAVKVANSAASKDAEILIMPFAQSSSVPGRSLRTSLRLSATESSRIVAACKLQNTTPTAAFHAGIALVLASLAARGPATRQVQYSTYALMNLRSACSAPWSTNIHFAATYHCISANNLVIDLTLPSTESHRPAELIQQQFPTALHQAAAFYRTLTLDPDYLAIVPELFSTKTPSLPRHEQCTVPEPSRAPNASLSSLGVVDRVVAARYRDFAVGEPWVVANEYGTGVGVFLSTWQGQMDLGAVWNEAFRSMEMVERFLELVKESVMCGLANVESAV